MTEVWLHTARTDARTCPVCQAMLDAATGISLEPTDPHPTPDVGSISLCAHCGAVLMMTPPGWRLATQDEVYALPLDLQQLLATYRPSSGPASGTNKRRPC